MVPFTFIRASTSPRASRISFDCFSAIDLAVDVAHTVHHFLRLDARQEDGRNDFGISIRPLISIARFSTVEMPGSIKEHV